jgi:hypothetical protein
MAGSEDDTGDDMTMMMLNDNANNNTNDIAMSDSSPKASLYMSDDSIASSGASDEPDRMASGYNGQTAQSRDK